MDDIRAPACEQEPIENAQTRLTHARMQIMASRQTATHIDESVLASRAEEIVRDHKFKDMDDYWAAQLSPPKMKATEFAHLIVTHMLLPCAGGLTEANIFDVLRHAIDERAPFIISDLLDESNKLFINNVDARKINFEELRISPRPAAEWISRSPFNAHVLPPALCAFLAQSGEDDKDFDNPSLDTAVAHRLAGGELPGSTVPWEKFCDSVRDDCDGWSDRKARLPKRGFGDRTIKRIVNLS